MNSQLIPKLVELWAAVNVVALLVLAALAYVSGKLILDWLESPDRRWSRAENEPLKPAGTAMPPAAADPKDPAAGSGLSPDAGA